MTYFQKSKLFALFLLVFSKSYSFSSYLVFVSRLSSIAWSLALGRRYECRVPPKLRTRGRTYPLEYLLALVTSAVVLCLN